MFGCGNPDWASTYHAVPKFIDDQLAAVGGDRLIERGQGNASSAELFDVFDDWKDKLLEKLGSSSERPTPTLAVKVESKQRQNILRYANLGTGKVISNKVITKEGVPVKRHIVLELPDDAEYQAGDYLEILPVTPAPFVRRALARFNLHADDLISLSNSASGGQKVNLPLDMPLSASDIFHGFVELGHPISARTLAKLATFTEDQGEKQSIEGLTQPEQFEAEVVKKRLSLLDVLERFPRVDMPLGEFLLCLPPIRIRQVSSESILS